MSDINRWNVVFLLDANPPQKIILLKRSPNKKFAPNFYTGIGGKIGDIPGFENETVLDSAYRELTEETEGGLMKDNIELKEYARCIYENGFSLHYFWGIYSGDKLPHFNPQDGSLEWVDTKKLLDRDFIPTTLEVCKEWAKRNFFTDHPFTVYVEEIGQERTVRLVKLLRVEDGLGD